MKVFQCSSGGMVPTIPTVFPSCYSLQTAATPQDSDYPGIFPLSASYPLDSSTSHSLVQSSPTSDSLTTAPAADNAAIAAEPTVPAASEESPSMENESVPSPEAATEVTPEATSLQAAPSMPFEQAVPNSAFGSAAQFLLRDSQAQNAASFIAAAAGCFRKRYPLHRAAAHLCTERPLLYLAAAERPGRHIRLWRDHPADCRGAAPRICRLRQHLLPVGDGGTLLQLFAQHCRPAAASFA